MAIVKLSNGGSVIVDDEDLCLVSAYLWRNTGGYAVTGNAAKGTHLIMHRLLLGPGAHYVDHRDGNGLNNSRANLRICTHTENMWNRKRNKNNTSGFKGVYWNKEKRAWVATITANRKRLLLGRFETAEKAARAYDEAATRLHGEFARLNFAR